MYWLACLKVNGVLKDDFTAWPHVVSMIFGHKSQDSVMAYGSLEIFAV